jgi:hypothetical protein
MATADFDFVSVNFSHLSSLYSLGMNGIEDIVLILLHTHARCCGSIFIEPLAINGWRGNTTSSIVVILFATADVCLLLRCLAVTTFICPTVPVYSHHVIASSLRLLIPSSLQITIYSPTVCACDTCNHPCERRLMLFWLQQFRIQFVATELSKVAIGSYSTSI